MTNREINAYILDTFTGLSCNEIRELAATGRAARDGGAEEIEIQDALDAKAAELSRAKGTPGTWPGRRTL